MRMHLNTAPSILCLYKYCYHQTNQESRTWHHTVSAFVRHTVQVNDPVVVQLQGNDPNGTIPTLEVLNQPAGATLVPPPQHAKYQRTALCAHHHRLNQLKRGVLVTPSIQV